MPAKPSASLRITLDISAALMDAAVKSAQLAAQSVRDAKRPRRGLTLRPGPATPLWNEFSAAVLAQLTRRGQKVRLARILGIPRQRLHEMLKSRRYLPDAERTLLLLVWSHARQNGRDLA